MMKYTELLAENHRRLALLPERRPYDPRTGEGCCGERTEVTTPLPDLPRAFVPVAMTRDADYSPRLGATAWERLRIRHDFEYWAWRCVRIFYKTAGGEGPFRLNAGQRRVLEVMEDDRRAGRPVRVIVLKARQWGCSTLVAVYMAWYQLVLLRNCNSLICGHVKDAATNIRSMLEYLLSQYPEELWDADENGGVRHPQLKSMGASQNMKALAGRDCRVTLATAIAPDAVRGANLSLAHLSEVAYYGATTQRSPEMLLKSIIGSVMPQPNTLVVMESTANGVGNFFHREWLRAEAGKSDKHAVFVPWSLIAEYSMDVADSDAATFFASFDAYERGLWDAGLTLQQIMWHRVTSRAYPSLDAFHAEFPFTPVEAFTLSGNHVFAPERIAELRRGTCPPAIVGELSRGVVRAESGGTLQMWEEPQDGAYYVAAVDIGGRSASADWSVISVLSHGAVPRVVAQWRGHTDHDVLADKAVALAALYNEALLVVESNTLESAGSCVGGDNSLTVIDRLRESYSNLYTRPVVDNLTGGMTTRIGFHTNRRTKSLLINTLIAAVRDGGYVERCDEACNELSTYIQHPNGSYAARDGCHDDILMTRAMALYVISTSAPAVAPASVPYPLPYL